MSHIFKPGDFAYWYDPKWGVDRVIELIANNNEEKKSTFPLIGTYPITKPLSERMQVFFTKDGRILPSYPVVLFTDKPVKDEDQMKFKHGDLVFYLPEKEWVSVLAYGGSPGKIYIQRSDVDFFNDDPSTLLEINEGGTLGGKQVLLKYNPFDKNDPNNPSSYTDECTEEKDADYFLKKAVEILKERGKERDVEKERSMARIVSVYNALTGQSMSVEDGWKFMAILKLVRIQIKPHEDGFLDALSYMALWGEEAYQNNNFGGNS